MSYQLRTLGSIADLHAVGPAWDDLCRRSGTASPVAQAEFVAQWMEQFAPRAAFHALVVHEGDRLVAALPLYGRRLKGPITVASLPVNDWSDAGELLIDAEADVSRAAKLLAHGLHQLAWPLVWLDEVELAASHWQTLLVALEVERARFSQRPIFTSGRVDLRGTWDAYLASRTKKHRHNMRRYAKRLEEGGPTEWRLFEQLAEGEVEPLLRRGFEVEDRGWKGAQGTSVLRAPGMFEYLLRQARELARRGQLWLGFIEHHGRAIAFDYGYVLDGRHYRAKIGFDEQFAWCCPGQLLALHELEAFHRQADRQSMNFLGPLSDALEKWTTAPYERQRLVIAQPTILGRSLLAAYTAAQRRRAALEAKPAAPITFTGDAETQRQPDARE